MNANMCASSYAINYALKASDLHTVCCHFMVNEYYTDISWSEQLLSYAKSRIFVPLIARFMGPRWGPSGAARTQVGPMLAPWTLLSGTLQRQVQIIWTLSLTENYNSRSVPLITAMCSQLDTSEKFETRKRTEVCLSTIENVVLCNFEKPCLNRTMKGLLILLALVHGIRIERTDIWWLVQWVSKQGQVITSHSICGM